VADNFLKIDGIPGESTDDKHKDWIEILTYNFGVTQSASAASRSATKASAAERANFNDVSVTKIVDKASPKISSACAKGDPIKEVLIECCRAGGDKHVYLNFKLEKVIITSVTLGGGSSGEPTETISFNYGKVMQEYTPVDRDGKPQGKVPFKWDLEANKAL
jgi:type VI secretion system secreted protein Hcp